MDYSHKTMITFTTEQKLAALRKVSPAKKEVVFSDALANSMKSALEKYELPEATHLSITRLIGAYVIELISLDVLLKSIDDPRIRQDVQRIVIPEIDRAIRDYKPEPEDTEETETITPQTQISPVIRPTFVTKSEVSTPIQQTTSIAPTPTIPVPTKPTTNTPATPIQPQIPTILTPFMQEKPPVAIPEAVHPERDAILKEIEEPTSKVNVEIPVRPSADQQLSGIVFNPKEEKTVVIPSPQIQTKQALPQNMNRVGRDPYREAIE